MGKICNVVNLPGSGTSIDPYTSTPAMDGNGSAGSASEYARGDHVHPSDTSKQPSTLGTPITIDETQETTVEGALSALNTAKANSSSLASVAFSGAYADVSGTPTLGTAAALNVSVSGDASISEVVKGDDSRLTDARPSSDVTNTYSASGTVPVSGTAVKSALETLDVTGDSSVAASKTLASWSETDGKVAITTQDISITKSQVSDFPTIPTVTDTYSGTSSDAMSGKAVKSAIDALDGTVSGSAGTSKTLSAFSQTDGVVSATFSDISITKSQVSDFPAIDTVVTQDSNNLITSGAVQFAIADLPEPMVFKGSLGTGGTITTLPTASAANEGYTYKVITDGTYATLVCHVGDVVVSNGEEWVLLPAGQTDTDTWRNIKVNGTEQLGNGISTGAVDFVNGTNTTVAFDSSGNKISVSVPTVSSSSAGVAPQGSAVSTQDQTTKFLREDGSWSAPSYTIDTNTTYTFEGGTNKITVTPSGGSAQDVTITPSIANNVTGSGTSGSLTKFNGANTVTDGPALSAAISSQDQTTKFLREDGTWSAPSYTTDTNTTYSLAVGTGGDADKIVLTPSSGTADKITVPYATNAGTVNGKTVAANVPADAVFTDTTYESKSAAQGGTAVSLVTTGEKYTWNSKADTSAIPSAYTSTPAMDGVGSAGSSTVWAKGDHVHPSDTTKQPKTLDTSLTIAGSTVTTVEGALDAINDCKVEMGTLNDIPFAVGKNVALNHTETSSVTTKIVISASSGTTYKYTVKIDNGGTSTYTYNENVVALYATVKNSSGHVVAGGIIRRGKTAQYNVSTSGTYTLNVYTSESSISMIGYGTIMDSDGNYLSDKVDRSGDTMTGALTVQGNITSTAEITDGGSNVLSDKYDATSLVFRKVRYTITSSNWSSTQSDGYYTYSLTTDAFNTYSGVTMLCAGAYDSTDPTSAQKAAYSLVDKWYMADGTGVTSATLYAKTKPTTTFYVELTGRYMAKNAASSSKALDITTANKLSVQYQLYDPSHYRADGFEFNGSAQASLFFEEQDVTISTTAWSSTVNASGYYTASVNMTWYVNSYIKPNVSLVGSTPATLPTAAQIAAYNLVDYFEVPDGDSVKTLNLYAKTKPTTTFYVHVSGVRMSI